MKEGEFFHRQYLRPTESLRDSPRFRKRLDGYFFDNVARSYGFEVARYILSELGVQVPIAGNGYYWSQFFERAELRDVLGTITATYRVLAPVTSAKAKEWLAFCSRALDEEALGYRVDRQGGVHYLVDEEFERSVASTIVALDKPEFANARNSLDRLNKALDQGPDTLSAVRSCWDANENVFKIIFDGEPARLTESELRRFDLRIASAYDGVALVSARQLKEGFAKWITAMHQYRHAPHATDPSPPPIDIAILLISQGLAYLRWQVGFAEA